MANETPTPTPAGGATPDPQARTAAEAKKIRDAKIVEARKLRAEADKLAAVAAADKAKADEAKLGKASPEQVKADESRQKADDAIAKAAQAERDASGEVPVVPKEGDMVKMTKGVQITEVHPATVKSHEAAGWKVQPVDPEEART